MDSWQLRWIERTDAEALARAHSFAAEKPLDRLALRAALDQPGLAERARLLEVTRAGRIHALAAEVGAETGGGERIAFLDGSLPGAAARALPALARPLCAVAFQPVWPELVRAGASVLEERVQLARLSAGPLPAPDPRVVRYDAAPPAASNALSPNAGLGFAVRDPDGRIAACAGVGFLVEGVAQIAFLHTREDCRRRGLARVVLAQCVRALEETGRTRVLAEIPCDDTAALRLFASLLFRGRARVRSFRLEVP